MSNEEDGRDDAPITLRSFRGSDLEDPPASPPAVIGEVELGSSPKPSGLDETPISSGRGYLPTNEPSASSIHLPKRPLPLGKCVYVHFGENKAGHFFSSKRLLRDSHFGDFINHYDLDSIVDTLANHILASPGADYANTFIGGDVGERRKVKINDHIKDVLVIPQGKMRAEANSANFAGCKMMGHPLADPEKMLEVMALTMFWSGLPAPYLRIKGFADVRNGMALRDPTLKSSFVAATWEFFKEPSYKLPAVAKKTIISPFPIHEHPLYKFKIASVYQPRVWDRQQLWENERTLAYIGGTEAMKEGKADVTYCQGNGMLAESSCQNNRLYVPLSDGRTLVGSPVGLFFRGKTDMTSHKILQEIKPEGIIPVEFHTPEEFARTCLYLNKNQLSGRELTYAVLRSKCEGMVFAGTFKGTAEKCSGILPEEGEPIDFKWNEQATKAYEIEKKLLWNTVYGLHGGTKLTPDPYYCCMFDVNDLQKGIAKPLDLRGATLEDIV